VPLSRSKRQSSRRTNAPGPIASARHSLSPHHRSRTGKPTNHRQRTDPSSTGRTPRRPAARVSPVGTATHDAAHGSRNPAFGRAPPHPARRSRGRRTGTSRATRQRRGIEARQDRRRCDQRHRDSAERAIQAARGDGYAGSRKENGIGHPTFRRNRLRFAGLRLSKGVQTGPIRSVWRHFVTESACAIWHLAHTAKDST
jgi:hypothetical protein